MNIRSRAFPGNRKSSGLGRRVIIGSGLAALVTLSLGVHAQAWPSKPVKFVVSWPAGGGADTVGRLVANALAKEIGQPIVVENKPGAGGKLGTQSVARSPADGYTLLFAAPSELSVAAATVAQMPYDPLKDLMPVAQVVTGPYVIAAHPSFPPNNLKELVAYAKANPGKANFASFGNNTLNHLYGEQLNAVAGIRTTHVPYRGSSPAITDLIGGQVQFMFDNPSGIVPLVKTGKLKVLAVMSSQRLPDAPNVPTIAEQGFPDFGSGTWFGVLAPAGTPQPIVDKLARQLTTVLRSPEVAKQLEERYLKPAGGTPQEFGTLIQSETAKWKSVVEKAGLTLE
jgi:tripartite-type tricarboxylate transporter receptor subunit TctC